MNSIFRFFRSHFGLQENINYIKEHIAFNEGNNGGFPSNIDAFAYDSSSGFVVVATSCGRIQYYGFEGIMGKCHIQNVGDSSQTKVEHLVCLSSSIILALCKGPCIVHFELKDGVLSKIDKTNFEADLNFRWKIYHLQKISGKSAALIFYLNNSVYRLTYEPYELKTMVDNENLKTWLEKEQKLTSITTVPNNSSIFLLFSEDGTVGLYKNSQFVRKFSFESSEEELIKELHWTTTENICYGISCNNKYSKWNVVLEENEQLRINELNPCISQQFGPFPCNEIRHFNIYSQFCEENSEILIFQGGKSSGKNDDRELITLQYGAHVEKFEVTSDVVGIVVVDRHAELSTENGLILICTKCEIIGIDLSSINFRVLRPRHFTSINNSTPTAHATVIEIEEHIWNQLENISNFFWEANEFSSRAWPLFYRKHETSDNPSSQTSYRQIYISGHSNGNVCIWKNGGINMELIFIIKTSSEFAHKILDDEDDLKLSNAKKHSKNKTRKIGFYDPFDDSEDVCITHVFLDPKSGILIVTNRGGYIFSYELCDQQSIFVKWDPVSIHNGNSKNIQGSYLKRRFTEIEYCPGYQPRKKENSKSPLIFHIPQSNKITALTYLHKKFCLVVGTSNGLFFLDTKYARLVHSDFHDKTKKYAAGVELNQLKRIQSLKKSLRKSFRRKKKTQTLTTLLTTDNPQELEEWEGIKINDFSEREVVSRNFGQQNSCYAQSSINTVTCIQSLQCAILDEKIISNVVAVGFIEGTVQFYNIIEHDVDLQTTFKAEKVRKIEVSHGQPVLNVTTTIEDGYFFSSTKIVVITEEQIRVYQCIPLLKRESYKLTVLEGLKIKNGTTATIPNIKNKKQLGFFVIVITNSGTVRVHSSHNLSEFLSLNFIAPSDTLGINSSCVAKNGNIHYLIKSSELQRSSLNTFNQIEARNL